MYLRLTFLALCLIFSNAFGSGFKVEFFDVGQGHCTLVKFKKGPPILVDAGSSWFPGETDGEKRNFKIRQLSRIADSINGAMPSARRKKPGEVDLHIIVSHGDSDHYNWIGGLLDLLKSRRIRFLLGGKKGDYSKEFQKIVDEHLVKLRSSLDPILQEQMKFYASDFKDIDSIPRIIPCEGAYCKILAAGTKGPDKNRNSIVVKIGDATHSVILTGDATGKTTNMIIGNHAPGVLKTDILQACHHGADSDDSNNRTWFAATDPLYLVISAGMRMDYKHPTEGTIANITSFTGGSARLKTDAPLHVVQYATKTRPLFNYSEMRDVPETVFRRSDDYLVAITRRGIFNTSNQGTITFEGDFGGRPPSFTKIIVGNTPKDMAFSYLKEPDSIRNIIAAKPSILGARPTKADFEGLSTRLTALPNLISLDLSKATITRHAHRNVIIKMIKNLTSLRELRLPKLPSAYVQLIKRSWDRGLIAPSLP